MFVANRQSMQPIKQMTKLTIRTFLRPKASESMPIINRARAKPNIKRARESWVSDMDVCKLWAIAGSDGKYRSDETVPTEAKRTVRAKIWLIDCLFCLAFMGVGAVDSWWLAFYRRRIDKSLFASLKVYYQYGVALSIVYLA